MSNQYIKGEGVFKKRNWKIYFEWLEGSTYNELAERFQLSHSTVKDIVHAHIPPKVRANPFLTANSYAKFRTWWRKQQSINKGPEVGKEETDALLSSPLTLEGTSLG